MADFNPLPDTLQGSVPAQAGPQPPYAAVPQTIPTDAASQDPTSGMRTGTAPQPGFSQVDPRVAAQQAEQQHHNMLGRLVKSIIGTESQYVTQPNGSVQRVETPQKPGTLFRGMLLSGILGAGTQAHSFGEGFAKGISTTAERGIQGQDKQRAQAIENQKLQQQQQKMSDEHATAAQHLAMNNAHTLGLMYSLNTVPQQEIERTNQATNVADRELQSAGAKTPQMVVNGQDINGQVGSAKAWENALLKDPKLHDAPDKNHYRIFLTTQNIPDGFKFDITKGGWVGPDGTPRDMHDYASVRAYDVPLDSLKQMRDMSGSEANAIIGTKQFEPDAKLHMTLSDAISLRSQSAKNALEAAQTKAAEARAHREDELTKKSLDIAEKNGQTALAQLFKQQIAGIDDSIKEKQKSDPSADVADLQAQRSAANQQFVDAVGSLNPKVAEAMDTAKKKQQETANLQSQAMDQARKKLQDNLPKAKQTGDILSQEDAQKYYQAYGDPNKAREAAIRDGWRIPTKEEVAGMVAGGGNTASVPITSSRTVPPGQAPF